MKIYFNADPRVKANQEDIDDNEVGIAANLATVTSIRNHMSVQSATFNDDASVTLEIANSQPEIVTVFYSAQSSVGNEKGIIVVSETGTHEIGTDEVGTDEFGT